MLVVVIDVVPVREVVVLALILTPPSVGVEVEVLEEEPAPVPRPGLLPVVPELLVVPTLALVFMLVLVQESAPTGATAVDCVVEVAPVCGPCRPHAACTAPTTRSSACSGCAYAKPSRSVFRWRSGSNGARALNAAATVRPAGRRSGVICIVDRMSSSQYTTLAIVLLLLLFKGYCCCCCCSCCCSCGCCSCGCCGCDCCCGWCCGCCGCCCNSICLGMVSKSNAFATAAAAGVVVDEDLCCGCTGRNARVEDDDDDDANHFHERKLGRIPPVENCAKIIGSTMGCVGAGGMNAC